MRLNNINRKGRILILALIPVFNFLPLAVSGTYNDCFVLLIQEKPVVPGLINVATGNEFLTDDLNSISAVRRYLSSHVTYPEEAVNEAQSGTVELFAIINNEGRVNEILVLQPARDYVDIEEIEVINYAPAGMEITESTRHESLMTESQRVVMSLPKCDIDDLFGKTVKITFKFVLK